MTIRKHFIMEQHISILEIKILQDFQNYSGNNNVTEKYIIEASIFGGKFIEANKCIFNITRCIQI